MATAVANCFFSVLTSSVKFRCCVSSQRYLATSHHSIASVTCKAVANHKRRPSSNRDRELKEGVSQKKSLRKSKDDDDGISGKRKAGGSQSAAFKSIGVQRKDKKEFKFDIKEQQVEPNNLKDAAFLDAVVKVYCTHTEPDYSLPWQKQRQYTSTGSAFMIGNGKLLTNAHCVEHHTQGNELQIRQANLYVFEGEELSFYEVLLRARQRREIVIGYLVSKAERAVINPTAKSERRRWSLEDAFVVIAEKERE